MSVHVEAQAHDGLTSPVPLTRIEEVVRFVLAEERVESAEISVTLLPDDEIADLNREYLSHEGPTDVISFPLEHPGDVVVGDIYVGAEQALRQAREMGLTPAEEIFRLAVHGILHVLGYEHPEGEDRTDSDMYRRQEELLGGFLRRGGATE